MQHVLLAKIWPKHSHTTFLLGLYHGIILTVSFCDSVIQNGRSWKQNSPLLLDPLGAGGGVEEPSLPMEKHLENLEFYICKPHLILHHTVPYSTILYHVQNGVRYCQSKYHAMVVGWGLVRVEGEEPSLSMEKRNLEYYICKQHLQLVLEMTSPSVITQSLNLGSMWVL